MLTSVITRTVAWCIGRPWRVIVLALLLATSAGIYSVRHFAIHTNIEDLLSQDLPWSKRAQDYQKRFPERDIVIVLNAPSPELVDQAAIKLTGALQARPDRFVSVAEPGGGAFFAQNGLLYLSTDDLRRFTTGLARADDLIGTLAADPSLRGSLDALSLAIMGVQRKEIKLDDLTWPMTLAATTVDAVLAGRPASFSWQVLASGRPPAPSELERFLQVKPVLDFNALQPGKAATDAIDQIAAQLKLADDNQARVRETGRIPISDADFGTIKQSIGLTGAVSVSGVIIILWLALRWFRLIGAVLISLFAGLAMSLAAGLLLVGAFNVISVAFFVLFVGLGVDFSLQFCVRYRAERNEFPDLGTALRSAARKAGLPLALAAAATAVGFASFLPTAYRGLSELGEIAGVGMLIAFLTSITLLPALLRTMNPPAEAHPVGFTALAPLDHFLVRHRIAIVAGTLLIVGLASPLLMFLPFDFDPNHMHDPRAQSVATYLELRKDPRIGANAIEVVSPNLSTATAVAGRLAALPEVAQARTLNNFVPDQQDAKLKLIHDAAAAIDSSLNPGELESEPSDQDTVDDLNGTADSLRKIAGTQSGGGAETARRLAGLLTQLAQADVSVRERAAQAIVPPLRFSLDRLRTMLKAQRVSIETIPPEIKREWVSDDGSARVEVLPKGDPDDTATLRKFVRAVTAIEPSATGPAVMLYEAANTVVRSFVEAGIFAFCAIAALLLIVLRRISDVLLTLVPLLVAGLATLELCVIFGLPLNFANIIALPLLLGVGVAFKIYYILAWRAGRTQLLQSSLTRAVVFSAMTTATAFGSLWLSSHPGTSSMGKLMALALVCTMLAAVLFQPALMGPPRVGAKE
jgi:uncharacterized protein